MAFYLQDELGMSTIARLVLGCGLTLLLACTTDPNQKKLKYIQRGEGYLKAGRFLEAAIEFRNAVNIDSRYAEAHYHLAIAYIGSKNYESALRELAEVIRIEPSDTRARMELAKLNIGRGQFTEAQAALEKVIELDPKNAQAHALLGQKYTITRELPKAIEELRQAINLDPQRVEYYSAQAVLYLSVGRSAEADATIKKLIESNPASAEVRQAAGQFYFMQGRMSEAEAEMQAAVSHDSKAVLPRILLGRIYLAAGKRGDAEKLYLELKEIAPDDPQAYGALARFYSSTGQKEKALAEYKVLLASKPKDREIKIRLVETLIDLNRVTDAEPLSRELRSDNPDEAQGLLLHGRIGIAQGRYQEAQETLEKVVRADPKSATGHYYLGIARRSLGLTDLARDSFAKALELSPQMQQASVALAGLQVQKGFHDEALRLTDRALSSEAPAPVYLVRARAMLAKGDLKEGEALLQEALSRNPASLPALALLLNLYTSQGKTAEAVQRLTGLVQQHPRNAGLHFLLGVGYFSVKDFARAEASIRQAIALDPRTPQVHTLLGNIYLAKGEVEQAKTHYRKAIEAEPRNVSNYIALQIQYTKEGNWEEAKKLGEKARELDPASPFIASELARLYLDHGGNVNVALSLAQEAKQKVPNDPSIAATLGWAYYKVGSFKQAISQLEESVRKEPGNALYQYHLGMAYLAARRFDAAGRVLQKALAVEPASPYQAQIREALAKVSKGLN